MLITCILVVLANPVPICSGDNDQLCAVPLTKGEIAPFSGQLLTTELALDLGLKADFFKEKLELELNYQKKFYGIELGLEKKLRELDVSSCKESKDLLMERLRESHSTPFFEKPIVVAVISVALTVLILWGSNQIFSE